MVHAIFKSAAETLEKHGSAIERRILGSLLGAMGKLIDEKRAQHERSLPLADYLSDRWDRARYLGFGVGTSIYDSSVVLGRVTVGTDCWIGPFTVLDGFGDLSIGHHCSISAGVQIYTHDSVAWATDGKAIERRPTKIGNHVYIGPGSIIGAGVTVGDRAVIGANSLVLVDVAANTKVAGSPARVIGTV